jgi:hypothetical protein
MQSLASPFVLESDAPMRLSVWQVELNSHADTVLSCPSP